MAAFAAQAAGGATWSLVMIGTQAVLMTITFIVAIPNGVGWLVADEAVVATISVVIADALGVALMLPETWRDPETETLSTFVPATVQRGFLGRSRSGRWMQCCCRIRCTTRWKTG